MIEIRSGSLSSRSDPVRAGRGPAALGIVAEDVRSGLTGSAFVTKGSSLPKKSFTASRSRFRIGSVLATSSLIIRWSAALVIFILGDLLFTK